MFHDFMQDVLDVNDDDELGFSRHERIPTSSELKDERIYGMMIIQAASSLHQPSFYSLMIIINDDDVLLILPMFLISVFLYFSWCLVKSWCAAGSSQSSVNLKCFENCHKNRVSCSRWWWEEQKTIWWKETSWYRLWLSPKWLWFLHDSSACDLSLFTHAYANGNKY